MSEVNLSFLQKTAINSFLPMLPSALGSVEDFLKKYIANLTLQDGEVRATISITALNDNIVICETYLSADDRVMRVESVKPAREFVETIVKQFTAIV